MLSTELPAHAGETVTLSGWVHRRRQLRAVSFLILRDRAGLAQVVAEPGTPLPPEESAVTVTGTVLANEVAPGGVELVHPEITVLSEPVERPPVELHRPVPTAGLATRLDAAAVRFVARVVGAANVREVTLFPRDLNRLTP